MYTSNDPREDIVSIMRLLYNRGFINIMGGNASIVSENRDLVYISPSSVPKNMLRKEDISLISIDGSILEGKPSSEYRMHLEIYRNIPASKAVLHAHLPNAVLAGELGIDLDPTLYIESMYSVGKCVAIVDRLPSGSIELAETVSRALKEKNCKVALLKGHGAVAYSDISLYHALDSLEGLEFLAYIELQKKSRDRCYS